MKSSKRYYIIAVLILLIGIQFLFGGHDEILSVVKKAEISEDAYFHSVIAKQVNAKETFYSIRQNTKKAHLFMSDNRQVYIEKDELSGALLCAVHFYNEEKLIVQQNETRLEITKGLNEIRKNGSSLSCDEPIIRKNNKYYVNLSGVARALDVDVEWDYATNTAVLTERVPAILPAKYDLRDYGAVVKARNQGKLGTCWAFASLNALETTLMPEEDMRLSVDHISMQNSFHMTQNDGGEYNMAIAYLTAWQGPVLEQDDPYADGETTPGLAPVKHVQEVQIIEEKNYEKIKEAVYKYGGVQSSLYTSLKDSTSKSVYYNSKEYAYCFMGEDRPNHDVVIIGWDDNFPKEKFNSPLQGDGAFICLNSWGPRFGDNGVFYVSYYDTNIGIHNIVYTKAEEPDNYSSLYQTDLCGWIGNLGYGDEKSYFSNAYTAREDEALEAVGFYATGKNTSYKVYFVPEFKDKSSFAEKKLVAKGNFENAGYYTVELDQVQRVKKNQKFAFIVEISTPNSVHPVAVEFVSENDKATQDVDITDGEGYISYQGAAWVSTEEEYKCNVCLKVYGNTIY